MAKPAMARRWTARRWSMPTWMSSVGGVLILLAHMQSSTAALKENGPCNLKGTPGTCRPYAACREEVRNNIQICGHTANGAIVCCPDSKPSLDNRITFPELSQRKSGWKCSEYRKLASLDLTAISLSLISFVSQITVPTCDSITKLIVGGNVTKPGEFPHMAALGWRQTNGDLSFKCGGSLISERYVLTAAHCYESIDGVFPSFVRLGDQHLFRDDDGARPKDYEIQDAIIHPNFKRRLGKYHDIALLYLAKDVTFRADIRPACLYDKEVAPSRPVIATGFGSTGVENDPCRHSGELGICRRYSACKDRLQNRITICSYTSQEAIVCCPEEGLPDNRYDSDDRPIWGQQPQQTAVSDRNARIAVKKCNEYRKLSYNRVTLSALTLTPTVVTYEVPKCDNIVKLIVGGNVTKPGEFPHMAAIGWRRGGVDSFDCGGSLISDQYVLTAAHCYTEVDGELPTFVRLGDQNLFREDDGAKPKDVSIADFIRHPDFVRNQGLYNDIALIKLVRPVTFSNFIRPACLYDQLQFTVDTAVATGYGLTEDHGDRSDELLKVSLNIYDNQLCSRGYANSRQLRKGIMASQLCVGNVGGGRDTCQGDSGGPLQITKQENHCVFYIIGITSFGQTCGSPVPAIYTRVASYLDWIESVVWNE